MSKFSRNMILTKFKKAIAYIIIYSNFSILFTACDSKSKEEKTSKLSENITQTDMKESKDKDKIEETTDNSIENRAETKDSLIRKEGKTISERFPVPSGFVRVESEEESFAYYLQNLPLKPHGTNVRYFDGREKHKDVYLAVVDFTLGDRDLQQCADGVIRLRAEYLYEKERFDKIHFNFVSGFHADFTKWSSGYGISINGNNVSWIPNSNNNGSYESFHKYLDIVFAYASTLSLEKELIEKPFEHLQVGDVFIQGGSPGHCVIVVDMAENEETGEKIFMLAQSYMPAQDIQILKGEGEESPWFSGNIEDTLYTPEWAFQTSELKTWE